MRCNPLLAFGFATAVGLISLSVFSTQSPAQTGGAATVSQTKAPSMQCNGARLLDPFKGKLAGSDLPVGLLPIDEKVRDSILGSGMPCQENVTPVGQEDVGLDNLQRGFDFYSWRTFIALNSPADGTSIGHAQPDTRTRWEDMDNFKQLLDVMLPANLQPPKWPSDRAAMEAERERLVPKECVDHDDPGCRPRGGADLSRHGRRAGSVPQIQVRRGGIWTDVLQVSIR